jgi:hypothetical protein
MMFAGKLRMCGLLPLSEYELFWMDEAILILGELNYEAVSEV